MRVRPVCMVRQVVRRTGEIQDRAARDITRYPRFSPSNNLLNDLPETGSGSEDENPGHVVSG